MALPATSAPRALLRTMTPTRALAPRQAASEHHFQALRSIASSTSSLAPASRTVRAEQRATWAPSEASSRQVARRSLSISTNPLRFPRSAPPPPPPHHSASSSGGAQDASSQQPKRPPSKHQLFYREIFPPLFRVLGYASVVYFSLHLLYKLLERDEQKTAHSGEIQRLQEQARRDILQAREAQQQAVAKGQEKVSAAADKVKQEGKSWWNWATGR